MRKAGFLVSRVASSSELISSNCGDRCCSSTCHKTFVDVNSVTKTSIMQSIQGELNTYCDSLDHAYIVVSSEIMESKFISLFCPQVLHSDSGFELGKAAKPLITSSS